MAFNRKSLTNVGNTGTDVSVFVYGTNEAKDSVSDMKANGFFDEAKDILGKGDIIMLSDGATTKNVVVTSGVGVTPVVTA